jgi:hypothetical protein
MSCNALLHDNTRHTRTFHVVVGLLKANCRHKCVLICLSLMSMQVEVHMEE